MRYLFKTFSKHEKKKPSVKLYQVNICGMFTDYLTSEIRIYQGRTKVVEPGMLKQSEIRLNELLKLFFKVYLTYET